MSQTFVKLHFTPAQSSWRDRFGRIWQLMRAKYEAAATRRLLGTLDDRALSDIGISRAQAQFVAEAPLWDVHR